MQEAQQGAEPVQYHMVHYTMRGYGDVSRGVLRKHGLFNVAGPLAHEVMEVMKDERIEARATRADTKMSVLYGAEAAQQACRRLIREQWEIQAEGGHCARTHRLYDAQGQGDTLYFGDRDCASFARAYQADVRHPERYSPGTLTFEVQHNEQTAGMAYNMLMNSANIHLSAGSMVVGKLASIGLNEPWMREIPPSKVMQRKHKSTKEGTLKWVKSSVKGSFRRACREGWHMEYLTALGFGSMNFDQAQDVTELLESWISGMAQWPEED